MLETLKETRDLSNPRDRTKALINETKIHQPQADIDRSMVVQKWRLEQLNNLPASIKQAKNKDFNSSKYLDELNAPPLVELLRNKASNDLNSSKLIS